MQAQVTPCLACISFQTARKKCELERLGHGIAKEGELTSDPLDMLIELML